MSSEVFGIDVICLVILITWLLYYYGTKTHNYFEKFGVKYIKPIPFFGNTLKSTFNRQHVIFCQKVVYDKFKGESFVGFFQNRDPFFMIRDPYLIQTICIKDFEHFYDRGRRIDERLDPLRAFNLVNLSGQKWKSLRQKLTPAFSSGKLKNMFQHFTECGSELLQYLKEPADNNVPVDIGEVSAKYTTDVIGTSAFGLQFNALRNPNSNFRRVGREMFKETIIQKMKLFLDAVHPKLPLLLNIRTFKKEYEDFFINLVKDTMKYREENNIEQNDFIQILMGIKKEDQAMTAGHNNNDDKTFSQEINQKDEVTAKQKPDNQILLDDKVLAANTAVFFVAGFDTTAITISFCLFELSLSHNIHIQDKLRSEVLATIKKHDNKITYETVKDMPYLECVVSETLRKYPAGGRLVRKCTKPYNIPGTKVVLKEGDKLLIPVYSIHHDPEYYPEPDLFDPDRFNEENIGKRPNGTYLPFGDGPRACIGSRFALLEVKAAVSKLLWKYQLTLNSKTKLPLKYHPRRLLLLPAQRIFIDFKPIEKSHD